MINKSSNVNNTSSAVFKRKIECLFALFTYSFVG